MSKRIKILLAVLLIAGVAVTIFRIFFVRGVRVPSGSMANTIIPGDHVLITKSFGQIERGTIILFQYHPEKFTSRERQRGDTAYYLARVIGLPGETIQTRGRTVYINGKPLPEQKVTVVERHYEEPLQPISTEGNGPYSVFYSRSPEEEEPTSDQQFAGETPFEIPKGWYFVMGDNRNNSEDSRFRGPVPKELIWGTAAVVWYSVAMKTDELRWDRMFKKIR